MKNALKFKKFPQIFYRHCSFQIIKKFGHGKVWKKTSKLSIGLKNYIDFAKQRKFSVKKRLSLQQNLSFIKNSQQKAANMDAFKPQ